MKTKLYATASTAAFMSDVLETVIVRQHGQDVRINKSTYDADQAEGGAKEYTLASAAKQDDNAAASAAAQPALTPAPGVTTPPPPSAPDATVAPPPIEPAPVNPPGAASPGALGVVKEGTGAKTRYFVAGLTTGVKVTDNDKIDIKGYETEQDAWKAITEATPH